MQSESRRLQRHLGADPTDPDEKVSAPASFRSREASYYEPLTTHRTRGLAPVVQTTVAGILTRWWPTVVFLTNRQTGCSTARHRYLAAGEAIVLIKGGSCRIPWLRARRRVRDVAYAWLSQRHRCETPSTLLTLQGAIFPDRGRCARCHRRYENLNERQG